MNDFLVNIGLEFHVQLNTEHKLFSSAKNSFSNEPNTNICLYDLSFPGVLPILNKEAVVEAIKACKALHMEIDEKLRFDRKHYFYSDLTKGYQITQKLFPIGKNGYVNLDDGSKIEIERLHIEEDTCKQIHSNSSTFIDFNRNDVPLIEIVTYPNIGSAKDAKKVAIKIRDLLKKYDISDGKMEDGSLRVDTNVSVKFFNQKSLGVKTEIKNLNTFENIETAINLEVERQISLLKNNEIIESSTFRYSEDEHKNVLMRNKVESINYKYISETNISPINIKKLILSTILEDIDESKPLEILPVSYKKALLSHKNIFKFYNECFSGFNDPSLGAKFLVNRIIAFLEKVNEISVEKVVSNDDFIMLMNLLSENKITEKDVRVLIEKHYQDGADYKKEIYLILNNSFTDKTVNDIIKLVLQENQTIVNDYKKGNTRAIGCLIKTINERTCGKANLSQVSKILKEKLEEIL